jgi:ribosome-binding protein aMBF1 (putative translation factor)
MIDMTPKGTKTGKEVLDGLLEDPEFRKEWERTALARAVAIEVIRYRAEHGISQTELGRRLGMHQPAIARLEEGEHNPSIDMLRRLSEKLEIDLNINIHAGELDVERLIKASA